MDLEVVKTTPVTEPHAQLNIGADFTHRTRPGGKCYGHVDARDPITGKSAWRCDFPSRRSQACSRPRGNLCSCPTRAAGCTRSTPRPARSCGRPTTASCHNGGIISYDANGKQYIATVTGFPSMVSEGYADVRRPVQSHGEGHRRADRLHFGMSVVRA